jgi:hypothetical protein
MDAIATLLVQDFEVLAVASTSPTNVAVTSTSTTKSQRTIGDVSSVERDQENTDHQTVLDNSGDVEIYERDPIAERMKMTAIPNPDRKRDRHLYSRLPMVYTQGKTWSSIEGDILALASKYVELARHPDVIVLTSRLDVDMLEIMQLF